MLNLIVVTSRMNTGEVEIRVEGFRSLFLLVAIPEGYSVTDRNGVVLVRGSTQTEAFTRLTALLSDKEQPDLETLIEGKAEWDF